MQERAESVRQLVDHLFRHRAGQMVATLTRIFGPARLDLAEDVVQEALLQALRQWPFRGVPANPGAWLIEVAKNRALDHLRRDAALRDKESELRRWAENGQNAATPDNADNPLSDDQLRLMFMCCHDALPREARVALTLKTLGGFGIAEIARAFLTPEPTIAQRLVRAKRQIKQQRLPFSVPTSHELRQRLDSVLEVLYLMFNEGYACHRGESLVRHDLIHESLRLTLLLIQQPTTAQPRVHALLALMLFQAARLPTRVDADGNLLLMADQDRSQWDQQMIQRGFHHLHLAGRGEELTEYHVQAGIASCHALAPNWQATDWRQILIYYDLLRGLNPSPVVLLNRAVAVAQLLGPMAALDELEGLHGHPQLRWYYLLPATQGELLRQLGHRSEAAGWFRRALAMVGSQPERRFILAKLRECAGNTADGGEPFPGKAGTCMHSTGQAPYQGEALSAVDPEVTSQ